MSTLWLGNSVVGEKDDPRCITLPVNLSSGPPVYGASKICDRASFVPQQQRPAVDSFIRELSIRDKPKKHLKNLDKLSKNNISVKKVGHFDTTKFGMQIAEEGSDQSQSNGKQTNSILKVKEPISSDLRRRFISNSMSSDEDSSDEELSELAKKINRSGTVAKFVKRSGQRNDVASSGDDAVDGKHAVGADGSRVNFKLNSAANRVDRNRNSLGSVEDEEGSFLHFISYFFP